MAAIITAITTIRIIHIYKEQEKNNILNEFQKDKFIL